jgi:hypothetical protein
MGIFLGDNLSVPQGPFYDLPMTVSPVKEAPLQEAERRRRRSEDPLVALHYQLAHARHDCDLEAIVVADASGIMVAGAGAWAVCEELAAYAPLLVRDGGVWHEPGLPGARASSLDASARLASLKLEVDVQKMTIDGQEVLICARGGVMRGWAIERAAEGAGRILKAA